MDDFNNILKEANECLNCKNPLCRNGCPINTRIPEFINAIKNNELELAYNILQENNIMSDVCSNVCPYDEYCSGNCVKGIKGEPVKVSKLEKYVNLWARQNNVKYEYKKSKQNNLKVAVIGSGPSGIECATELAKKGYSVTIFEQEEKIGGLLTYGIPAFRLPRNITNNLMNRLADLNIEIKTNKKLGKDINLTELKEQGYKAIFLGIGADVTSTYKLNSNKCKNIYKSSYVLKQYNAKREIKNLGNVIVIGGGNVSTDCARAVLRMGAKSSTIVYRRDREKMTARQIELQEALKDGAKIIYNTKVLNVDLENEKIKWVNCIQTDSSKEKIEDIPNSEFSINADTVIFAIGSKPDIELLKTQGIEVNQNGLIKTNENCMTNIESVFAGGDLVIDDNRTVCKAIELGKKAAKRNRNFFKK